MKKLLWSLLILALIPAPTLAELPQQSGGSLFDKEKAQKEIEIMKSILETVTRGVSRRDRGDRVFYLPDPGPAELATVFAGSSSRIDGYYLYGQGTSFILSVSSVTADPAEDYAELEAEIQELKNSDLSPSFKALQLRYLETQLRRHGRRSRGLVSIGDFSSGAIAIGDAVDAERARAPRAPSQLESDVTEAEVARRIAEIEAELAEAKAKASEQYQQQTAGRTALRAELIETIANHGDSLTHLGNDEYINLILASSSGAWYSTSRGSRRGTQILSIKKSDIRAYKSGSINFDTFTSRVLEYTY